MSIIANKLKVFLCHGSEDKPLIRSIYEKLLSDGIQPWLDEKDILPGQDWDSEIRQAVKQCDVILVCLSSRTVEKSGYLQKELRFALDIADEKPMGSIFIIPVKLDECDIPERLFMWQWVKYTETVGYQRIMDSLKKCASQKGIEIIQSGEMHLRACVINFDVKALYLPSRTAERFNFKVKVDGVDFIEVNSFSKSFFTSRAIILGTHEIQVEYDVVFPSVPTRPRLPGDNKYIAVGSTEKRVINFQQGTYFITLSRIRREISFWDSLKSIFSADDEIQNYSLNIMYKN